MRAEPPDRKLRIVMSVGLLTLVAAFARTQRGGPSAPNVAEGAPSTARSASPEIRALGPLAVGTVVDGYRLDRIEALTGEARLTLSQGGTRCILGLGAPGPSRPPALVPFSDVYVWYTTEDDATPPPPSLIQEVVRALRASDSTTPLHQQIAGWLPH